MIKNIKQVILLLIIAIINLLMVVDVYADEKRDGISVIEKYSYEVFPENSRDTRKKRILEIEYRHFKNNLLYISKMTSVSSYETVKVKMSHTGQFIWGIKNIYKPPDDYRKEDIWIQRDKIYIKKETIKKRKIKEFSIRKDKPYAVDASLLVMMRKFPFEKDITWKVFIVDFSQHSLVVSVRNTGIETITVPAGKFECYRMEVKMNLFIFHPKIILWITKDEPHHMVRYMGKKGPFTSKYITSLTKKE
jgi:hypothetical protein